MTTDDESATDTKTLEGAPPRFKGAQLSPGTCVGRYVVVDRVGEGGMGVVYKAYDPQLGREIALKLVTTARRSEGLIRDRFLREARALALLSHPNVINVHDVGTLGEDVFIAMEFVEGPTLRQWLREAPRTRREILDVFLAAGEGLVAAHRAGLVHRDFKPDNVVVSSDGRVRVLDFGLARTADAAEGVTTIAEAVGVAREERALSPSSPSRSGSARALTSLTEGGAVMGTPRFMAPEQHLGEPVDERADQFSFCVSLYQALYDRPPFAGSSVADIATNVLEGRVSEPPPGARVPGWLRQVVLRGLSVEPGDRYPSMAALLGAIRADPNAKLARRLPALALVALVALGGTAWIVAHRSEARACAGADRALRGVWDDERRTAVRAAFRASHLPYAEVVLGTVERTLDEYAGAWTAMHVDACEATHLRHEQSQDLLDLRMGCLSDRLTEMRTLSDVFARGDAKVVERAVQSAQSLPRLERCADAAALRARVAPPNDAEARRRVEQVKGELARMIAFEASGDYAQGIALATQTLDGARAAHYPPIEAEVNLRLAELLGDAGRFEDASRALHRALVTATAGRDDEYAARAAVALVHDEGARRSHFEEADQWAELAEASITRVQRKDELLGALYTNRSALRRREGRQEESLEDAKRALALTLRVFAPDSNRAVIAYHFLGNSEYALAHYPEALDAYGHAMAILEKSVGPDHPALSEPLIGMGNVYGDIGQHDRAIATYQRALAIFERTQPDHPDIGIIYNNVGAELEAMGKPREALAEYLRALAQRERVLGPSYELTGTLDNLGEVELDLGESDEAASYFHRALEMGERVLGPANPLCAGALWGLGESARRKGRLDEAWGYFQRALPVAEKSLGPTHPKLARPLLLGIGLIQLARGRAADAVATLERAEKLIVGEAGPPADVEEVRAALAKARAAVVLGNAR